MINDQSINILNNFIIIKIRRTEFFILCFAEKITEYIFLEDYKF